MSFQLQIMISSLTSLPVCQAGTTLSLTVTRSVVEVFSPFQKLYIDSVLSKNRFHFNPGGK